MRRQDELIALYPGQPTFARKFILAQMESLSRSFDSDDLLGFLQAQTLEEEAPIANQALTSLLRFLPGFISKRYGIGEVGERTRTGIGVGVSALLPVPDHEDEESSLLRAAAFHVLAPVQEPLLQLAFTGRGRARILARLALTRFPFQDVTDRLSEGVRAPHPDFGMMLAYVHQGRRREHDAAFLAKVGRHGARNPDLVLLLSEFEPALVSPAIRDLSRVDHPLIRANLAIALGGLKGVEPRSLEPLLEPRDPWVTVFVLHALERLRTVQALELVGRIYESSDDEFIHLHAVRTAGFLRVEGAREFCAEALSSSSERVRGQALESLVRLGTLREELRPAAIRLIGSQAFKARINAILILARPEISIPRALRELLLDSDPLLRLEGAFCLGYFDSDLSLSCLAALVAKDPHPLVRVQAIKSLSRFPVEKSLPLLLPLAADHDLRIARLAATVLGRYSGPDATIVSETIIELLSKSGSGNAVPELQRALLLRALGLASSRAEHPGAHLILFGGLESPDPRVSLGAVEGLKVFPAELPEEAKRNLVRLSESLSEKLAARALLVRFLNGDLESIDRMSLMLRQSDGSGSLAMLDSLLELSFLLMVAPLVSRFPGLAKRLDPVRTSGNFKPIQMESQTQIGDEEAPPLRELERDALDPYEMSAKFSLSGIRQGIIGSDEAGEDPAGSIEDSPSEQLDPGQLVLHLSSESVRNTSKMPVLAMDTADHSWWLSHGKPADLNNASATRARTRLTLGLGVLALALLAFVGWKSLFQGVIQGGTILPMEPGIHVVEFVGDVVTVPSGQPVIGTIRVEVGQGIRSSGEDAHVVLADRSGLKVRLEGPARVVLNEVDEDHQRVRMTVERGRYTFDCPEAGEIEVHCVPYTMRCRGCRFFLAQARGSMTAIVDVGPMDLIQEGGTSRVLNTGEFQTLDQP